METGQHSPLQSESLPSSSAAFHSHSYGPQLPRQPEYLQLFTGEREYPAASSYDKHFNQTFPPSQQASSFPRVSRDLTGPLHGCYPSHESPCLDFADRFLAPATTVRNIFDEMDYCAIDEDSSKLLPRNADGLTQGDYSSFDGTGTSSYNQYSMCFSAQGNHNSFTSDSGYGTSSEYDQATNGVQFSNLDAFVKHEWEDFEMAETSFNPMFLVPNGGLHYPVANMHVAITENDIQAFDAIAQNIRDALDTGLTKRRLLLAKTKGLKQELDTLKNDMSAVSMDIDLDEKFTRQSPVRKSRGRLPPTIKPPRLDPYKTDVEHDRAVARYQAEFKKRHKLKGYEMLVSFTDCNINRLMERLLGFQLLENAIHSFLEERANAQEHAKLETFEGVVTGAENDLKEIWQCFNMLNDIGL